MLREHALEQSTPGKVLGTITLPYILAGICLSALLTLCVLILTHLRWAPREVVLPEP